MSAIDKLAQEILERAKAIIASDRPNQAVLHRLDVLEHNILSAIKDPAKINLEPLTAQLKAANDSLDATVKANQP